VIPLLLTLSSCAAHKEIDIQPVFIYKVNPIHLPVIECRPEPAVPPLLTDKSKKPTDTDALLWSEDTRVAGADCRDGLHRDKQYQDNFNKAVDDFNAKADEEAKKK
jgi:hypothetical protein